MTKRITVLGSTGSIGKNTLDVIRCAEPGRYRVVALTANKNVDELLRQAIEFKPEFIAIADPSLREQLIARLPDFDGVIGAGRESLVEAAQVPADFVMASIMGAAGLEPTLEALKQGLTLGLANKECLVCAGPWFMEQARAYGSKIVPVDSEHNAIFQVLEHDKPEGVSRLILTASGGPFRAYKREDLLQVTPEQALNHPVWSMGAKITVDSASLMNKGLELIEASFLFDRPSKDIDVLVHPQSIVHSMVEYIDGSVLSQMGSPDMRTPIAYALGWPERQNAPVERLDLTKGQGLTFFHPDTDLFPALNVARQALEEGGAATNVLNAANEIAVDAFLNKSLRFVDIPVVAMSVLEQAAKENGFAAGNRSLEQIRHFDEWARTSARHVIQGLSRP